MTDAHVRIAQPARAICIALAAVIAGTGLSGEAAHADPGDRLFGNTVDVADTTIAPHPGEIARRIATLNWSVLRRLCLPGERVARPRPLSLHLVGPPLVTVYPLAVERLAYDPDSLSWEGEIRGHPSDSVHLSGIKVCGRDRAEWALAGSITLGSREFRIRSLPRGRVAISQVDVLAGTVHIRPGRQGEAATA